MLAAFQNHPLRSGTSFGLMYVASFCFILAFAALLLQIGSTLGIISMLMLIFVGGSYLFVGFVCRTMSLDAFYNANRIPRVETVAQALSSGIIGSGIFVLLGGIFYQSSDIGLAFFWGWLLGIALMSTLFAAEFSRSGAMTLPALFGQTQHALLLRIAVLLVVLACSSIFLAAQIEFIIRIVGQLFEISARPAVAIIATAVGFCVVFSGMQGVTLIRAIAFPVILIAFLAPLIWIGLEISGIPIPQIALGYGALQPIAEINQELISAAIETRESIANNFANGDIGLLPYLSTMLCVALGTAAMPHLLMHFTTLEAGRLARRSGVLSFLLVLLFMSAVPVAAAFVKFDLYTTLLGLPLGILEAEAGWVFGLSGADNLPLISICGAVVANATEALAACGGGPNHLLSITDIGINPEWLILTKAMLHQLPDLVTLMLGTGALLALFTTCDGIILVLGTSIANDGYILLVRPRSPKSVTLFITRFLLVLITGATFVLTYRFRPDPGLLFEVSIALTAASLFPLLINRFWMEPENSLFTLVAIVFGFGFTASVLCVKIFKPNHAQPLVELPVSNFQIGLIGALGGFIIMLIPPVFRAIRSIATPKQVEDAAT